MIVINYVYGFHYCQSYVMILVLSGYFCNLVSFNWERFTLNLLTPTLPFFNLSVKVFYFNIFAKAIPELRLKFGFNMILNLKVSFYNQ